MERMVKVTNMVNKTVGVKLPEYGINRKWVRKGQSVPIPFDALSQMLWHNGFRNMIDKGILYQLLTKFYILDDEGRRQIAHTLFFILIQNTRVIVIRIMIGNKNLLDINMCIE